MLAVQLVNLFAFEAIGIAGRAQLAVGQLKGLVLPVDVGLGPEHLPLGIGQMHVAEGGGLMGLAHQVDPIAGERGRGLIDHRIAGDHEGVGFIVVLELAAGYVHGAMMGLQQQRRAGGSLCMRVGRDQHGRGRYRKRHHQ